MMLIGEPVRKVVDHAGWWTYTEMWLHWEQVVPRWELQQNINTNEILGLIQDQARELNP